MTEHKKGFRGTHELALNTKLYGAYLRFQNEMIDIDSYDDFEYLVNEHMGEFCIILQDFDTRLAKKIRYILNYFKYHKDKIIFLSGAKGSGKTAFAFWLAEEIYKSVFNMHFAYVGVKIKEGLLPKWCKNYVDLNQVPFHSFAIVDEMALQFNARRYQTDKNINLTQLMAVSRHRHLSVILITQDPRIAEVNAWRLKDLIVYKQSNTYDLPDREGGSANAIIKFYRFIRQWLKPKHKEDCLLEDPSNNKIMLFQNTLPDCWSEELSEAFNLVQFDFSDKQDTIKKQIKRKGGLDISNY